MNEAIYFGGRRIVGVGFGLGDVGDLLAYRQEWEPYISAHLDLWKMLNSRLESVSDAKNCPPGIFTDAQIQTMSPSARSFCAALQISRTRISDTDPGGILTAWNLWKDKSSADIVAGAVPMLQWHQEVVMRVGKDFAQQLLSISNMWKGLSLQLPDVPSFSVQQEIRARIEGAYIDTKGVIELLGYSAGDLLGKASTLVDATADGLTDAAKAIPKALNWAFVVGAVAVAVVGGALIVYYVPRRSDPPRQALPAPV